MSETGHEEEYNDGLIAMLELIWGEGFLSPGGPKAVRAIVAGLDLAGMLAIDVGCGIGGPALTLARAGAARVIGLDVETGVVARAEERVSRAGRVSTMLINLPDVLGNRLKLMCVGNRAQSE